ncbi:MAG: hypothetical protein ACW98K_08135 [Candidatus Kariarchaeaceae archaeon]|jgi:hypothetical protein
MKLKHNILITILALLLSSLTLQAVLVNPPEETVEVSSISFLTPSSIVIDGNLSLNEWDDAEHVTQWYMDADQTNYDGFNYLYLAEDVAHLYIAIDLVSDQTNDETDEWVGIWLNTNKTIIDVPDLQNATKMWYEALDKGMESLIFAVDNNQEMPFLNSAGGLVSRYYGDLKSLNDAIAIEGTFEGSLDDLDANGDNKFANMTSEYNGTHHVYRMDINISLTDYYDLFPDIYTNNTGSANIRTPFYNNVTIDEHYLTIRDSSGNLLLGNANQTKTIHTSTSYGFEDITALPGNFTQDEVVQFTFIGVNNAPFKTSFDSFTFDLKTPRNTFLADGYLNYPYSSIKNYEIAWSFDGSENNITAHRSFEFKIPKSELEGYIQDTDLGIQIGGYGTLVSFNNTHHWVFTNNTITGMPHMFSAEYIYYDMPMKGWAPLNPILASISSPSTTGNITLNWNADANAVNWTLLRHSAEITQSNIGDAEILATGLTQSQHSDTGNANGTYWYAVVVVDTLGYAYLSNSESVLVEIPAQTTGPGTSTTTSSVSESTTTSETTGSATTSDDGSSPGLTLSLSIVALSVTLIYYKRKK